MCRGSRPLCTVLAVLLAFAGGIVDLCSCDASSHGAWCDDAGAAAQASCHGERGPAPSPADGCCAALEPATPSCCDETAQEPQQQAVKAAGCGCPVIVFDRSPSESSATSSHVDLSTELGGALTPVLLAGWAAPDALEPWQAVRASEPRAPALRRHLELHVLRC